jgi:hypothetical protein
VPLRPLRRRKLFASKAVVEGVLEVAFRFLFLLEWVHTLPSSDLMVNKLESHGRAQTSTPSNRPLRISKLVGSH